MVMKSLFDETKLGGMKLKNRFFRSATHEGLAEQGRVTDELMQVYEKLAQGGVGAIITGLAYVSDREEHVPGQIGIADDSCIGEYQKMTDTIHAYGAKVILQIAWIGSQNFPGTGEKLAWGPSAVADLAYKNTPAEMTVQDIRLVQDAFAAAALRAKKAGFDGVQMHVAHGYLLSKFLTPYYNRRSDDYGGTIENRARMVLETYQLIRERVGPDYPILVKINGDDFMDQGLSIEDSKYVCKKLAELGVDAIEVSGGTGSSRKNENALRKITAEQESYFREYAAEIANAVNVPVILVGGNRDFETLTQLLNETKIEYVAFSRPFIREKDLINRWQSGDTSKAACISCNKCWNSKDICIFSK